MFGDSNPTRAFGGIQVVVVGIFLLAIGGTVGLSLLGLPTELWAVAFLVLVLVFGAASWPLIEKLHPRHERTDRT